MSGQSPGTPLNQGVKVGNATLPPEGPKSVPFKLDFSAQASYLISLVYLFQQSLISNVQGVYVDNSGATKPTTIYVDNTQQEIDVPPGAQMYVPLVLTENSQITVASLGSTVVPIKFFNFPMPFGIWYPNQGPTNNLYDISGNLLTSDQALIPYIDPVYGLKVDVTKTVGGSSAGSEFTAAINAPIANGDTLFFRRYSALTLNALNIGLTGDAYIAGAAQNVGIQLIDQDAGVTVWSGNVWVPGALPANPVPLVTVVNLTSMNYYSATPSGNLFIRTYGSAAFTQGNFFANILYHLA